MGEEAEEERVVRGLDRVPVADVDLVLAVVELGAPRLDGQAARGGGVHDLVHHALWVHRHPGPVHARRRGVDALPAALAVGIEAARQAADAIGEARDVDLAGMDEAEALGIGLHNAFALATAVHASVISRFKFVNRGIKRAQWSVLTGCKRPGILFEGGFVTNGQECLLVASDTYRQQVSNAIGDAVVNYRKALESAMAAKH